MRKEKNRSLPSSQANNLNKNVELLSNILPTIDDKTMIEQLDDIINDKGELKEIINVWYQYQEQIEDIEPYDNGLMEPILELRKEHFLSAFYKGKSVYSHEEFGTLYKPISQVMMCLYFMQYMYITIHPNRIYNDMSSLGVVIDGVEFDRLKEFIDANTNFKDGNLRDIGELINIVPTKNNVMSALAIKALFKLSTYKNISMQPLYQTVKEARDPRVAYATKTPAPTQEKESWISIFKQRSEVTLGEVGEIKAYFNIHDLKTMYNITTYNELALIEESNNMFDYKLIEKSNDKFDYMRENTFINLPKHIGFFLDPIVMNIIQPHMVRYLDLKEMRNVIAIAYVLAMRVNKHIGYMIHTVDGDEEGSPEIKRFVDNTYNHPNRTMGSQRVDSNYTDLFFGDEGKNYLNFSLDTEISLKTGTYMDKHGSFKLDYSKYVSLAILKPIFDPTK